VVERVDIRGGDTVTLEQLATILSPFVAAFCASGWIHTQLGNLRQDLVRMDERIKSLEKKV
jgi:hypothetical protein